MGWSLLLCLLSPSVIALLGKRDLIGLGTQLVKHIHRFPWTTSFSPAYIFHTFYILHSTFYILNSKFYILLPTFGRSPKTTVMCYREGDTLFKLAFIRVAYPCHKPLLEDVVCTLTYLSRGGQYAMTFRYCVTGLCDGKEEVGLWQHGGWGLAFRPVYQKVLDVDEEQQKSHWCFEWTNKQTNN